jgi:intein/homing endonuclease
MGSSYIEERKTSAPLFNCSFHGSKNISTDFAEPFCFTMDMSMLGVGGGGDTEGAGTVKIRKPYQGNYVLMVEDNREGWVDLIRIILDTYVGKGSLPSNIDYSKVRPAGAPIKTFGGVSGGPQPLIQLVTDIHSILQPLIGRYITSTAIIDLYNAIGRCVVSGNLRRTALIMLGHADDMAFLDLKNPKINQERLNAWGWTSNNTIKATVDMDYSIPAEMTAVNGEPGYWWQENAQHYGRMIDPSNDLDEQADGTNACGEITLYSSEMCNVPETFPARHETLEEYKRTLKYAYLYGKTVSLLSTHNEKTNAIQLRNRRLGISQSGIAQAIAKRGIREHCRWCDEGYKYLKQLDKIYSHWLCVPESIKITAVKPSGSISTLPNATPGIHYPFAEYYLRAIRIAKGSSFATTLQKAGYLTEDDVVDPSSVVIYFPIKEKDFERSREDLSLWEQLELAAQMQAYWADNQVSCLTGDAIIRTNYGFKRFNELPCFMGIPDLPGCYPYSDNLQVLDANNEWQSIKALVINNPKETLKIETEGGQTIQGTSEHKLQIIDRDLSLQWRSLSDISPNDYIVESINQASYKSSNEITYRKLKEFNYIKRTNAKKDVYIPVILSKDLGEFLGYMASDGHITFDGKTFGLTQVSNNIGTRFIALVQKLFNLKVTKTEDIRSTNLFRFISHSSEVNEWLQWIGLYDKEQRKRTPWPILMAGNHVLKSFLKGLTLDGYISKDNGRIYLHTTNSLSFAQETCQLLKSLGFQPSIFLVQQKRTMLSPTNGKEYPCEPAWSVSVSAGQAKRFIRMIGFAEDRKQYNDVFKSAIPEHRLLYGEVPDIGFREQLRILSHNYKSDFLKNHFHSAAQYDFGQAISRELLLQIVDLGGKVPEHLLSNRLAFRKVISVKPAGKAITYDLTVENSHSYLANGFVSHNCTITFKPEEAKDIKRALELYGPRLKSVSFLPLENHGYEQAPYQKITKERYEELIAVLKPYSFDTAETQGDEKTYCDSDHCEIIRK